MPPAPDPSFKDEEGRRIFPWPKSFAEIVQTAAVSTMTLFCEGETRIEVDFPPLPVADLDWNTCDVSETRVVDSNLTHAIAFSKLLIKDPRRIPDLDPREALERAQKGVVQEPDKMRKLVEVNLKKREDPTGAAQKRLGRAVRIIFPNKTDMLRARDIHYEKWRKMERPELLRRGYYDEVNESTWQGPFEDVFIFVIAQEAGELVKIRNYVEKAEAMAARQGRVCRYVMFNLNLQKLRADIGYFQTITPLRPGLATPQIQFDFLSTFRNAYTISFAKYTLTVFRDPFNVNYGGALYRAYPGPWQIFMQDIDGSYRTVDVHDKRPSIQAVKRKLIRAFGLNKDANLDDDPINDDIYRPENARSYSSLSKSIPQLLTEGFGDAMWWEDCLGEELSEKWRV